MFSCFVFQIRLCRHHRHTLHCPITLRLTFICSGIVSQTVIEHSNYRHSWLFRQTYTPLLSSEPTGGLPHRYLPLTDYYYMSRKVLHNNNS